MTRVYGIRVKCHNMETKNDVILYLYKHTLHFLISLQKIVISSFLNTDIQLIRKKKEKRLTTQIKKISL